MHADSHICGPQKITWMLGQPQMFQWKAHDHVLIHPHLPIWHPFIKPDQLDPLIKNQMQPMPCPQFSPIMESQTWMNPLIIDIQK